MSPAPASLTLPCDAAALLPHGPAGCMLERLLTWQDGAGQALAVVTDRSALIDDRQRLDRCALIEMMAQTCAAGLGWEGRQQGMVKARIGYLVAIRSFIWTADARAGDRLLISVATTGAFGEFRVVSGQVCREGDQCELARGELRLWRQPLSAGAPPSRDRTA